jgi:transcriptional regulator with XRE-family HTH domain
MTARRFNGEKARELRENADITIRELVAAIADKVRERRGDPPLTGLDLDAAEQAALLKEDSWHPDHIRNIELGHLGPGTELARAWAAALGVKRADLMTDAAEAAPASQ